MHPTALLALLALAPTLAFASPVSTPSSSTGTTSPLVRRGGIDFCGQNLPRAGDACAFGSSETQPHACSIDDETVVVSFLPVCGESRLMGA